jgi:hypothetical protein
MVNMGKDIDYIIKDNKELQSLKGRRDWAKAY